MDIRNIIVLIRGGGDLGSGIAWKFHASGIRTAVIDLPDPLSIRSEVSFSSAITRGSITIEGITGRRTESAPGFEDGLIPVFTTKDPAATIKPDVIIDATLKGIDSRFTAKGDAPFTIGLGPGFIAPENIDCVIETNRGHNLGRVIWKGSAEEYTGIPGDIAGSAGERLLRSPADGRFEPLKKIGDRVQKNELIGWVARKEVRAGVHGIIRGIAPENMHLKKGFKMGDIDPRGVRENVFSISDKARCIAGGALEAVLSWTSGRVPVD